MKNRTHPICLAIASALIICTFCVESAAGRSPSAPTNNTGAPGHNTCASCHSGSGSGSVAIDFPGIGEYEPGQSYSMTVTVAETGKNRFGFSMVARDTDNNTVDVGSWSAGSPRTTTGGTGNNHVGHLNAPFDADDGDDNDSHTFTVNWTAPAAGVGDVTFYAVGNAANGNGARGSGDHIYLTTLTITEPVAVNEPPSLSVPPDPVNATTGLSIPITGVSVDDPDAADGNVTVSLSVNNGTLSVSDSVPGGVGAGGITTNGSASVTLDGTLAELNATLGDPGGLLYQSDPGFTGADPLQLLVNDNGNTGPGGEQTDDAEISISVNPPPSIGDLEMIGGDSLQFILSGIPGQTYTVEHSGDLETWTFLEEVTLVGGTAPVTDSTISGITSRFYRASESAP